MGDSWKSFKTGFARTKHKVLEKFGATETTVDARIKQESEKLFVLFKLVKRLKKNVEKYEDILKNIIILQNEVAQDILTFKETDPTFLAYQECQKNIEKERARITDQLEFFYHDPLRNYLAQFREIKSRLAELEQRRLDMDRYHRDYTIKANKGKDATSLAKTEGKHTKTKEGYQSLLDELLRDIDALFEDRKPVFDPVFANYLNRNSELFNLASNNYRNNVLPLVSHINEYDVQNRVWVISSIEESSLTKNVRSSSVFTTPPKDYNASPQGRSRASTIATTSPTHSTTNQSPPLQTSPQLSSQQQDLAYNTNNNSSVPPQTNVYNPNNNPNNNLGGVSLNKNPPPHTGGGGGSPPFAPMYPNPNSQPIQPPQPQPQQPQQQPPPQQYQPPTAKFNQMSLGGGAVGTGGPNVSTQPQRKSMYLPNQQPPVNNQFKLPANNLKPAPGTNSGRPLPSPKSPTAPPSTSRKGEALYDFQGLDSNELTFKKGDMISFTKFTGDWYEGELNGVRGLVPSNYVKLQ